VRYELIVINTDIGRFESLYLRVQQAYVVFTGKPYYFKGVALFVYNIEGGLSYRTSGTENKDFLFHTLIPVRNLIPVK